MVLLDFRAQSLILDKISIKTLDLYKSTLETYLFIINTSTRRS